jgi:hypothetical protein
MQQKREQWRRWFSSREPAHWMKATFFASLPSLGTQDLAAGRAVRVGQTLEFDVGDDVLELAIAIRRDLLGVIRLPAGGPDDGAGLQADDFFLHVEIDRAVFAGGLDGLAFSAADHRGVDHIALRVGHVVWQKRSLDLAQVVVEGIVDFRGRGLAAFATGGAVLVDEARREFHGDAVVALVAGDPGDLSHGQDLDARICLQAAQVYFQTAGGMAHLGEIAVELNGPTTQVGVLFHQHDLLAGFRSLKCCGHAGDAAAHDQDGLVGRHN